MKVVWTKGLDEDAKKEMETDYKSAVYLRKRLIRILEDKIEIIRKENLSTDAYDCPNWALKQADQVGYERALTEIIRNLR